MESNTALITAASGLEKFLVGSKPGVIKESLVAQISAYMYYQANVLAKLSTNQEFQQMFSKVIFNQIDKDFGEYIDSLARSKPKSLHHVYEWKRVGSKNARLFKLNKLSQEGLSFKIGFEYQISKTAVPNSFSKRRHVFKNKAAVMEAGMPLKIAPRASQRLVFEYGGTTVFMPKGASVTVKRPGGAAAKNQFTLAYSRFFNGNLVNASIKRSGFQNIFGQKLKQALKIPADIKKVQYKFSANRIRSEADSELALAFGGAL